MNIVYERCAGIDVHKRSVVVCTITPDQVSEPGGNPCCHGKYGQLLETHF